MLSVAHAPRKNLSYHGSPPSQRGFVLCAIKLFQLQMMERTTSSLYTLKKREEKTVNNNNYYNIITDQMNEIYYDIVLCYNQDK